MGDNDLFLFDLTTIKKEQGIDENYPLCVSVEVSWYGLNATNGYIKILETSFADYSDITKNRWLEIPTLNCLTNTASRTIKRTHACCTANYIGIRINLGTATQYNYDVKVKILNSTK